MIQQDQAEKILEQLHQVTDSRLITNLELDVKAIKPEMDAVFEEYYQRTFRESHKLNYEIELHPHLERLSITPNDWYTLEVFKTLFKVDSSKPYNDNLSLHISKVEPKPKKSIWGEIKDERRKQDKKWGQQNHPILCNVLLDSEPRRMCSEYEIPSENRAKALVEIHAKRKSLTFMHILIEEISEAASCQRDTKKLREELIQSGAVIVAMIESLDRNGE